MTVALIYGATLLNLLLVLVNVGLVGLGLKIYTELTKDKLQDKRKEAP